MKTQNIYTLKIHKLSQAQYERVKAQGQLAEDAFYLTPDTTADFVVEQGVREGFTYRKWESGIVECWGVVTRTHQRLADAEPAFGEFYIFGSENIALPTGLFNGEPVIHVTCKQPNARNCLLGNSRFLSADMALAQWVYIEDAPFAAFDIIYQISVKGRWK